MSLEQIAKESGILNVPIAFFEHFVEHYQSKEFTIEDLKEDSVFEQCFLPDTPKKVVKKDSKKVSKKISKKSTEKVVKKSTPKLSPEERQGEKDQDKCQCRIWKGGLDSVQCSRNKKVGDFCNDHIKKGAAEGTWWLGIITDPRPEAPVGGKDMTVHFWTDQQQPPKEKKSPKETPKEKKSPKKVTISKETPEDIVKEVLYELVDNMANTGEDEKTQTCSEDVADMADFDDELEDDKTLACSGGVADIADFDGELEEDTTEYKNDDLDPDSDEEGEIEYLSDSEDEDDCI
jgi:hypothetical protein